MAPRQWLVLDTPVTNTTAHEHCTILLHHVRHLRSHLNTTNQKHIPKQRCLELFESFEQMARKLFSQPELAKIEERILQEMAFTRQSIINSIATEGTTLVCRGVESLHGGPPKELDGVSASDLDLTVKHLDKGVQERLRGMQPKVILKEVNINIERDPSIPKLPADIPGSLTDPMARAVAFKHLRSGDVTISVRKDEDKTLLSRSTKWIKMFGPEARVQVETYGIVMHSVRIKNLQLGDADKQLCAAQALVAANVSRLEELKSHESIKYIGWIKKTDGSQTGQSSIVLELSTPQDANEIIRMHLV